MVEISEDCSDLAVSVAQQFESSIDSHREMFSAIDYENMIAKIA